MSKLILHRRLLMVFLVPFIAGSCSISQKSLRPVTVKNETVPVEHQTTTDLISGFRKIKKFNDLIPEGTKPNNGLFKIYKVSDKYYFEIPDSLLGREMLAVTRLVRAPAGLKVETHSYGGEEENSQVWKWERHDRQIFIRVPNYTVRADSTTDMYRSVYNSNLDVIMASFDIKAYNRDSTGVMIDATDFYNGDLPAVSISAALKKSFKASTMDFPKSYIDSIKSYPLNIESREVKTYRVPDFPTDHDNGLVTFELNTSMMILPKVPMKARIYDERVGFFKQDQLDYGSNAQKADLTSYVLRWKMEPKDEAAYLRGELVEPKKQIVFYIDPATPKKWVPFFIKGVNDWQKAFEAAGFKNAIIAREAPTPKEDPEFSLEDARYSVIRYLASDLENAYGPHVADPRSGEILESHLFFYHNHLKLLHDWYFIQTAAVNPVARTMELPDSIMGDLISHVITHEVGHTLGLAHNVIASHAYPVDSLRSKTFTDHHGTAASIMDYARFNYVAQPGDHVTHFTPEIGEADLWSIKWGYSWYPKGQTPLSESKTLQKWVKERSGNSLYTWVHESTNQDPRAQYEDLGDNSMLASAYGIANLKLILPSIEKWTYRAGYDYSDLQDMYMQVIGQYRRYIGHVTANVGGLHVNAKTYDEGGSADVYVNKATQHEAVLFLNKELFSTPAWLIDRKELAQFDNGIIVSQIQLLQVHALEDLLFPPRMARMIDNEFKNGGQAYTFSALLLDLRKGIFSAGPTDQFKRSLQRGYIDYLRTLLTSDYKSTLTLPAEKLSKYGLQPNNLSLSDVRPIIRAELITIAKELPVNGDAIDIVHFSDLNKRIKKALNAQNLEDVSKN